MTATPSRPAMLVGGAEPSFQGPHAHALLLGGPCPNLFAGRIPKSPPPVVSGSTTSSRAGQGSATRFRLNAQVLFLTFPQCATSKELAMENLLKLFPDLEWAIIAQEAHQDGTPHLHLVTRLAKKTNIRNSTLLDTIAGQHGNYQGAKKLKSVLKYVRKSDNEPLEHGPVPTALDTAALDIKVPQGELVFEKLMGGVPVREIVSDHPSYAMINLRKIKEMKTYLSMKTTTIPMIQIHSHSTTSWMTNKIMNWFRLQFQSPRLFKAAQLWLWGPANTRKTSAVLKFLEFKRVYIMPKEEFDDFYSDDDFDMAFLDEFTPGCRKVEFLKVFLQGGPCAIRQKGSQSMKTKNLPVIICSNFSPEECFSGKDLEAMLIRLQVEFVAEPLDLDAVSITPDTTNANPEEFECSECDHAAKVSLEFQH